MCDCYLHKCEKCNKEIPMHLGDYATARDEVAVYCHKHIPRNMGVANGVVWEVTEDDDLKVGERVFVEALTQNAEENWGQNHPNVLDCKAIQIFGKETL